jgi:hypothetical protein
MTSGIAFMAENRSEANRPNRQMPFDDWLAIRYHTAFTKVATNRIAPNRTAVRSVSLPSQSHALSRPLAYLVSALRYFVLRPADRFASDGPNQSRTTLTEHLA